VQTNFRETLIRIGAHGAWRTGLLRMTQSFSERYEVGSSPNGTAVLQRAISPKFAILYYHRVGTQGVPFHSGMEPRLFEEQIRFLCKAYRIISMDQLCCELEDGGPKGQAVAITFDDGYRDVYTNAFPILRKYDVPATVYLTARAIETGEAPWYDRIFAAVMFSPSKTIRVDVDGLQLSSLASYDKLKIATEIVTQLRRLPNDLRLKACASLERTMRLPGSELKDRMLTWRQIREMSRAQIFFGAHTMNHPVVSRLSAAERDHELWHSKRVLEERLQSAVDHFAFPFGSPADIDSNACSLLSSFGYRSAVSTVMGVNTPSTNRYLLRRVGGEEPSTARLALLLRWVFLNNRIPTTELQALERAIGHESAVACSHAGPEKQVVTEVRDA
jgi:peptidoglycan/xylan/chitin deacetylase (PgdA/CDA1 family)